MDKFWSMWDGWMLCTNGERSVKVNKRVPKVIYSEWPNNLIFTILYSRDSNFLLNVMFYLSHSSRDRHVQRFRFKDAFILALETKVWFLFSWKRIPCRRVDDLINNFPVRRKIDAHLTLFITSLRKLARTGVCRYAISLITFVLRQSAASKFNLFACLLSREKGVVEEKLKTIFNRNHI